MACLGLKPTHHDKVQARGLFHKTRLENKPGLFWLVKLIAGEFCFIKQT